MLTGAIVFSIPQPRRSSLCKLSLNYSRCTEPPNPCGPFGSIPWTLNSNFLFRPDLFSIQFERAGLFVPHLRLDFYLPNTQPTVFWIKYRTAEGLPSRWQCAEQPGYVIILIRRVFLPSSHHHGAEPRLPLAIFASIRIRSNDPCFS